jgi:hypothetical protein
LEWSTAAWYGAAGIIAEEPLSLVTFALLIVGFLAGGSADDRGGAVAGRTKFLTATEKKVSAKLAVAHQARRWQENRVVLKRLDSVC